MPEFQYARPEPKRRFDRLWLKSELAFTAVLVTGRALRKLLRKYRPDQPRVPAGRPDGGQWTRVGGGGGGGTGADGSEPGLDLLQDIFTDDTGAAPWDFFANTYSATGELAAQLVANSDDTTTSTEWDTGGVEPWTVRQTLTGADHAVITTSELYRDGTGQIRFGSGADGNLALAAADGELALMPLDQVPEEALLYAPSGGDVLRPLTAGAARIVQAAGAGGAAGGAIFVAGVTALSSPAGGPAVTPLSDDVRLAFRDDGQLPVIQQRSEPGPIDLFTGGTWQTLSEVSVTAGPAGTVMIDGDQLRSAIGSERFEALGNLDERGVFFSMQPTPVAPRDVPAGSIFESGQSRGWLYSPQGTVVDWGAHYAQVGPGQAMVLELRQPSIRGLTWTSGDDKPMIGPLDIVDVDRACPRFSDVHQVAVEADARVRAANPHLSPRDPGTFIHREIANEVGKWADMDVGIWSEQGSFEGFGSKRPFLTRGAVRFDVLEDAGRGTVCVYDTKTGDTDMTPRQMLRYWHEARLFRPGTNRIYVIPLFTKR